MSVERQQATRDRSGVSTIKDLIRAALDNGKTVRQLEADSGGRVRFQTFQELSNAAPKNFPRDVHDTITGMALALGVSETAIVLAYAKGMGIHIATGSPFALRVPAGVDRLDTAVQESFLSLMRAVVRNSLESAPQPDAPDVDNEEEEELPHGPKRPPYGRLGGQRQQAREHRADNPD